MVIPTTAKEFVFSPSSLVEWERHNKCVAKWHAFWVKRQFQRPDTFYTRIGRYFEYLCLGKSAHDRDPVCTPELNKLGDVPIAYRRAQEQAKIFERLFTPGDEAYLNEKIVYRHLKITSKGSPKMRGIIDFVTENQETGVLTIWDLKLVGSVDATHGPQPWGDIQNIDPIQLGTYKIIFEEEFQRVVKTKYMLFEHGPMSKRQAVELIIDKEAQEEISVRYMDAYALFKVAEAGDFEMWTPSLPTCKDCPLQCNLRMKYDPDEIVD